MTSETELDGERLSVVLDIRHPFSYLALHPSYEFADEMGVEIDWLPIRGHTLVAPSTPGPDDDRGTRHRRFRAQMIAREIAVYSAVQGLTLASPYRDGSAEAFHLGWLWIRAHAPDRLRAYLTQAFADYWSTPRDRTTLDDVAGLLEESAFDVVAFREWTARHGRKARESVASALAEAGVNQAPAYILKGEVFYGRQHLPMIRWILQGRQADRPIQGS